MPTKTLAQLRKEKTQNLPTRMMTICLDLDALADVQRLRTERLEISRTSPAMREAGDGDDVEEDTPKRPRKMGDKAPPRIAEIDTELESLYARMRDSEGELLLRAIPGGEWLRWKDAHPAREGNEIDERLAWGYCNAVDLLDTMGRYVAEWNGETLAEDDWEKWLRDAIAPADQRDMVTRVVEMHEANISVPKGPNDSSAAAKRDSASK